MALCEQEILNADHLASLRQLATDKKVEINCCCRNTHNTPLIALCRSNRSDSLLPALKILLACKTLDLTLRNHSGHNALTSLCRYNQHLNLIECVRLLVNKGIDLSAKDNYGRIALHLLCEFYRGENLIEVARLLISEKVDSADLKKSLRILHGRRFRTKLLSELIRPIINRPPRECSDVSYGQVIVLAFILHIFLF